MRLAKFGALGAFCCVALYPPCALAAQDATTTVVVPWGMWLASFLDWARTGAIGVIAWATSQFAPPIVKMLLGDAAIARAVDYAIASVDGACRDRQLSVSVSSQVAQQAVRYLVDEEPEIAGWLGDTIGARVLAQLSRIESLPSAAILPPPMPH
jgi:hypothetical protein